MNIEDDLQRALRRKPAPPDLADRVIARLETGRVLTAEERRQGVPGDAEERRQGVPGDREERRQGVPGDREERRQGVPGDRSRRRTLAPWLAAAAALTLAVSGGTRYYLQQQEAAEAERVKQEIRLALQITSDMFARAQQRIEATTETP